MGMIRAPSGSPVPLVTTLHDVDTALELVRLYLLNGGKWEWVEEFADEWLDFRNELRGIIITQEYEAEVSNAVL